MTITAKVIAHSNARDETVSSIITMELRYPRFIHSEFMTHRVFSRNASSSRAIPIERMIQDVIDDPAMPVSWGRNQPGMQAGEELSQDEIDTCRTAWESARNAAVLHASIMASEGAHKQIANRLLEPFAHISVVVTATDWDNFFALRCHPAADPTMRALAEAMRDAIARRGPKGNDWHLPYVSAEQITEAFIKDGRSAWSTLAMISAARCARVSYLNHDGTQPDIEKDLALARRLLESKHMSPFEHQARVTGEDGTALWGNLNGWDQFRKMIEDQL